MLSKISAATAISNKRVNCKREKRERRKLLKKSACDVIKMRDYPSFFLGIFFSTPPLLIPHFYKIRIFWATYFTYVIILPRAIRGCTIKENHISSAVTEILRYRQTVKNILLLLYKDFPISISLINQWNPSFSSHGVTFLFCCPFFQIQSSHLCIFSKCQIIPHFYDVIFFWFFWDTL